MEQTDFLVAKTTAGDLEIFPGHADHERDEAFAKHSGHSIIQRCATREEAQALVGTLTDQAVAAMMS
jgi:hypothetical protein